MITTKPAKEAPGRTAYLVLGMHRSGTSAVTQLLALAGAQLPENVMPGDEHNARGYFEPWKIALFNDERLRAAGSAWDDPFALPFRSLPDAEEQTWLDRAQGLFAQEYGRVRWPLLKDPRVTVLLPFWRKVLGEAGVGLRCVVPVRHPLAVAGSLGKRNGFAAEKSVLLWSAYMLAAEAYTRDLPRACVSYDRLLDDWRGELRRIEHAHGAATPKPAARSAKAIDAFLSRDLRHNATSGELSGLGWAGALAGSVYDWFAAAAADQSPDPAPLDAAAQDLLRRGEEIGPLISPMTRELDTLRAELRESRAAFEAERREAAEQAATTERELRATMARDREALEGGWRADVARLEQEIWDAGLRLDSVLSD